METLQKKIDEAMQRPFVGEVIFSDEELSWIYAKANGLLRSYDYGYISTIPSMREGLIFVAMVNAAKSWEADEDKFWTCIARTLLGSDDCSQKVYHYLTELIQKLGRRGQILSIEGCTKRYYATIIMHSFSPVESTEAFFELCWEIYCEDLQLSYSENDNIFERIAKELSVRFDEDGGKEIDFVLGSKVYALRIGIKRFAVEFTDAMSRLIQDTICLIDKVFRNELLDSNSYYARLIREWWNKKELTLGLLRQRKKRLEKVAIDYASIKPKYIMENGKVSLTIPAIRLKDNFACRPELVIYKEGKQIFHRVLWTQGSGLTMTTSPLTVDLEEIISEGDIDLSITIFHADGIIYNSKKTLERTFLLFKDGREVFAQECLPGNYNLFTFDLDALTQYPDNIKKQYANHYVINALEGEAIQSIRRTILFVTEKQDREVWTYVDKQKDTVYLFEGEEYLVIDGELKLAVKNTENLSDYGVRYENSSWRLRDFSVEIKGEIHYYNISELLSVCEPQKITVFKYSNNRIVCNINIVKFNNIQILFDKEFYYDKQSKGTVRFLTEKFDESVSFDINDEKISITLDDGELLLKAPIIKWRIDDRDWETAYNEKGLWYKDITNSSELELDIPDNFAYQIGLTNNQTLENCGNSYNKYKLGQTIYSQLSGMGDVTVFLKLENTVALPLVQIHTVEKFLSDPIMVISQRYMAWVAKENYIGGKEDAFLIVISQDGQVVAEYDGEQDNYTLDISQIEDGFYDVKVELIEKGFLQKKRILWKNKICIGDENDLRFKNKILILNKVMLDKQAEFTPMKPIYVENIKFLKERDGNLFYIGNMYFVHKDGRKIYLNSMKNSYGTYDRTNPVRLELRTNKTCWLVAGLEGDIDDFLGELFFDRYSQLSNEDKGTQTIHYYAFEVRENNV